MLFRMIEPLFLKYALEGLALDLELISLSSWIMVNIKLLQSYPVYYNQGILLPSKRC